MRAKIDFAHGSAVLSHKENDITLAGVGAIRFACNICGHAWTFFPPHKDKCSVCGENEQAYAHSKKIDDLERRIKALEDMLNEIHS